MICLLGTNLLNLLIPRQTAIVIDSLLGVNAANPWLAVFIFVLLRLISSDCGLSLFRQWLWMPVKYYSEESISRAAYSHMMNLSADFHDSKSSSEMVMAIHAGSSVSKVIETLLLQAAPMLLDMGVAIVYLSITFGPYEGFITVATGSCFVLLANRLIANAAGANRARNNAIYREFSVRFSGLEGWHTVAMFNQLGYEDNRHADAVADRWTKEKQFMIRWDLAVGLQSVVLLCGLSASAFLAVWRILQGRATSGQFTMLLMYWSQLSAPLKFFASLGKTLNDDLVGAERILSIMKKTPTVENRKCARPLKYVTGQVELDGVEFSYDGERSVIKQASLVVPGGQTVAFVGSTGAGKSTLLKLLNRFYDVTKGTIRIDGQDIRDVDLFR
jgi:ABC-type transport system involved in Fe-S cluster assembly fused permease/ATPase subunit